MNQLITDSPLNGVLDAMSNGGAGFKTYPGLDGVPHVARAPRMLRKDDPQSLQPQQAGKVHAELFLLSDDTQREAYEKRMSFVYSSAKLGKSLITYIDRRFDDKTSTWRIYLEWIELFTYDPIPAPTPEIRRG